MPGRATAVTNGNDLVRAVSDLGRALGLEAQEQVRVARRIWGAERRIDVVLTDPKTRKNLGLECKYQGTRGTAEEKIPSTIQDIAAWPIPGLVVFAGDGFTENMRSFLISSGKAVEYDELESWLQLFFGLPVGMAPPSLLPDPPWVRKKNSPAPPDPAPPNPQSTLL